MPSEKVEELASNGKTQLIESQIIGETQINLNVYFGCV